jgi:CHAT domain-containing protein
MFSYCQIQPKHRRFPSLLKLAASCGALGLFALFFLHARSAVGTASANSLRAEAVARNLSVQAPSEKSQSKEDTLALRQPLERKLAGGEAHRFSLALQAGQFARVAVMQQGIDVVVRLLDAGDKELAAVDSPNGDAGAEVLYWVAQAAATLRVEVRALDAKAAAGQYRIELAEVRGTTVADEKRIAAQRRMSAGSQLREQGKPENYRQALTEFEAGLKLWQEAGEGQQAAHSELMMGWTLADLGEKAEAQKRYEQSRRGYEAVKDGGGAAMAQQSLSNLSKSSAEISEAAKVFAAAEALRKQGTGEAYRQAVIQYAAAAQFYRAEGKQAQAALSLQWAGFLSSNLGEKQEALKYFSQALPLYRAVGDRSGEAATLNSIGSVYDELGEKQEALKYCSQALPLYRAVGDRSGEAATLHNIGGVYSVLGEKQEALKYYNQALPLSRAAGERSGEATTLISIGLVYSALGEQQEALKYCSQALPLYRAVGDRRGEAATLNNIGGVYSALGEKQEALKYYNQALPLFRAVGDRRTEAATLNNIGGVYSALGEQQEALKYYNQALSLKRAMGDRSGAAAALNNIGLVYAALGEKQEALKYYSQALPLSRAVGERRGEATTLNNIGRVYSVLGEQQEALKYFSQALPLYRAVGDRRGEAGTLSNVGAVWNDLQQPRAAIAFLKQSVNYLQQLRGTNRGLNTEAQRAFLRSNEGNYIQLADLLLLQRRPAETMQAMHLSRDQEFYDPTGGTPPMAGARTLTLTPHELVFASRLETALDRITPISQQLMQLQAQVNTRKPSAEEATQLKQLNSALDAEVAAFQQLLPQLVAELNAAPEAENRLTSTDDLTEMQQTLRTLQQRTGTQAAAVYTLMGAEECRTLLVTAETVTTASAKIKFADLNQKAQLLLQRLQSDLYDPQVPGKELYDVLFKPIEPEVRKSGATLLLWSLDRNLRSLPMTALWDGKQYLAERFQHAVFTRPTPERMLREVSRTWTGQGFGTAKAWPGFTPLPGVGRELELLFVDAKTRRNGVLSGQAVQDAGFTKEALLAGLKQRKPLVHIASHFSFRAGDDTGSFLLLGNGEHLTLAEMKQTPDLFSGVELLTLSACNTATQRGDQFGREVDGFAEQAQRLGAGAVMASLWEVSDAITPELMAEFYRLRQNGAGMTKAAALQQAQLALLHGKLKANADAPRRSERVGEIKGGAPAFKRDPQAPFAHPYYWAPFILIGNWR